MNVCFSVFYVSHNSSIFVLYRVIPNNLNKCHTTSNTIEVQKLTKLCGTSIIHNGQEYLI